MAAEKRLLRALRREVCVPPPIWLMRQAGRYLPEYRKLRERAGSFLELCLSPKLAAEASLQPIQRFGLDGAIVFSDILIVPYGLGQGVSFEEGHGPRLDSVDVSSLLAVSKATFARRVEFVYETLAALHRELPSETALIGFAGAPWTVACYMIEGGSSGTYSLVKRFAGAERAEFENLIGVLVDMTTEHLLRQAKAGAEVLQIFDSWAGVLEGTSLDDWAMRPTVEIVRRLKAERPDVSVILFPRGIGEAYAKYVAKCECDALSLDRTIGLDWIAEHVQPTKVAQGNLDPATLVRGGEQLVRETCEILDRLAGQPFVFNLSHGVSPETPVEHVAELCRLVRNSPKR